MAHDFHFSAKVVSVANRVACQVVLRLAVAEKERLADADGFALSFEAVVGVDAIDNPSANVALHGVHARFLLTRLRRVDAWAKRSAAKPESLSKDVGIGFDLDILAVANYVI